MHTTQTVTEAQFSLKQRWAIMPHMPPVLSDPQYPSLNRLETIINHLFTHQPTVETLYTLSQLPQNSRPDASPSCYINVT
jgi:hypothetical protein